MKQQFEKGCLSEDIPWEIETDHLAFGYGSCCAHCTEIFPDHPRYDARVKYRQFLCPAVVTAFNQCGYDATNVCLQCILENAEKLAPSLSPPCPAG